MREQDREVFDKARRFVYRNARPLDLARWKYHFENGSAQEVLAALSAYQNEDGGFGHGLEEDNMNPNSIPMQAWRATVVLRAVKGLHKTEPIVVKLLDYLEHTSEFDGEKWSNVTASNNDWPHASWWTYPNAPWYQDTERERFCGRYNPTASLAGFILRYAGVDCDFGQKALGIAKEAVEALFQTGDPQDMHVLSCFIQLWEDIGAAGLSDRFEMERLTAFLQESVAKTITQDTSVWETDYICKPSQFFRDRESVFYEENREAALYECEFIRKTQMPDGGYAVTWNWDAYPEAWAVSKNWWRAEITVNNMIYLDNMDAEA
ncbi:MAG: hypothetical protein K2N39_09110 [Lachnospiraceae bacterium]|nr:hypothetical protein [Lachnospiraceae bacterium]